MRYMEIQVLEDDYKVAICRSLYDTEPLILSKPPFLVSELELGELQKDIEWLKGAEDGQTLLFDYSRARKIKLIVSIAAKNFDEASTAFSKLMNALRSKCAFLETKWKGQTEHLWWQILSVDNVQSAEFNSWFWRRKVQGYIPEIEIELTSYPFGIGSCQLVNIFSSWRPFRILENDWDKVGSVTITPIPNGSRISLGAGSKLTEKGYHELSGELVSILAWSAEGSVTGIEYVFTEFNAGMEKIAEKSFPVSGSGLIWKLDYQQPEWEEETVYISREIRNNSSTGKSFDVCKWLVADSTYLSDPDKALGLIEFEIPGIESDVEPACDLLVETHDVSPGEDSNSAQFFCVGVASGKNHLVYDWKGTQEKHIFYGSTAFKIPDLDNLLLNGGFELGNTTHWTTFTEGTNPYLGVVTSRAYEGRYSLKMGCGTGSGWCNTMVTSSAIDVSEGCFYLINVWTSGYMVEQIKRHIRPRHYVIAYDGYNNYIKKFEPELFSGGRIEWRRRTIFLTPQDLKNVAKFKVRYQVYSSKAQKLQNRYYYFDGGQVLRIKPSDFPLAKLKVSQGFYFPDLFLEVDGGLDIDVVLFIIGENYRIDSVYLERISQPGNDYYGSQIFTSKKPIYLQGGDISVQCVIIPVTEAPTNIYYDRFALFPAESFLLIRGEEEGIGRVERHSFSDLISNRQVGGFGKGILRLPLGEASGLAYFSDGSTPFKSGDVKLLLRPLRLFSGGD